MTHRASKVTADHLRRDAYLYVRRVVENQESTRRQYALRQRALALDWPSERVGVIDTDLGKSGASATDRAGFQRPLGLKGTMSEAELHVLRAGLQGGYLAKARRGELRIRLPVRFVYDEAGQVRLDPDRQVQDK